MARTPRGGSVEGHVRRQFGDRFSVVDQVRSRLHILEKLAEVDWDLLLSLLDGSHFDKVKVEMLDHDAEGYFDPQTRILHLPAGKPGTDGESIKGDKGEQGQIGKQGKDGKDGTAGLTPLYHFWIDETGFFRYKLIGYKNLETGQEYSSDPQLG